MVRRSPELRLRRQLGLVDATAVALGAIVGAGVFVTLGEAAATTGGSLPLALVLGAAVATLNGLSAAELGVTYPRAGGAYEFGYQVLTPLLAFLSGWVFLLAAMTASATYTLTFAAYVQPLLPGVPPRLLGVALALVAVALNVRGVSVSASANRTFVVLKVGVLLVFVGLGLSAVDVRNFQPFLVGGPAGLIQAGALLFFAYTGYARPVTIVEEIRDPRRTLPRAVVIALGGSLGLYLMVAVVALGLVGPSALGQSAAPLREAAAATGVGFAPNLLSLGALVATVSVLLTELWGLSRLMFAMARRGDLPAWLGRLSGAARTPRQAVLAVGAIVVLLTALLDLRPLLEASSLSLLLYYGVVNLAALRLRPDQRLYPRLVPAAGLLGCLSLAFFLPPTALLVVALTALAGLAYYVYLRPGRGA